MSGIDESLYNRDADFVPPIHTEFSVPPIETKEASKDPELPEFDPRWKEPLDGLLFIGNLQMTFTWPGRTGHRFKIKTIDTDTYLKVSQYAKKFENTLGDMKAYQAAVVAACLVSIDDKPIAVPVLSGEDDFDARVFFCGKMFAWTLETIYLQFCVLENTVAQVIDNLGKASGAPSAIPGSNLDSELQSVEAYLTVVDPLITYKS